MAQTHAERMNQPGCFGHLVSAGLRDALDVASRPSFGGLTTFRFHMTTGEVVESESMRAIDALRLAEATETIERYYRYWPETDQWALRWTREGGLR